MRRITGSAPLWSASVTYRSRTSGSRSCPSAAAMRTTSTFAATTCSRTVPDPVSAAARRTNAVLRGSTAWMTPFPSSPTQSPTTGKSAGADARRRRGATRARTSPSSVSDVVGATVLDGGASGAQPFAPERLRTPHPTRRPSRALRGPARGHCPRRCAQSASARSMPASIVGAENSNPSSRSRAGKRTLPEQQHLLAPSRRREASTAKARCRAGPPGVRARVRAPSRTAALVTGIRSREVDGAG